MGGQTTLDPFLLKEKIGLACIRHPMIWKTVGATSHEHLMMDWDKYKALSIECSPLTHVTKDDPPVWIRYGKPAPVPVIKGDGIHHAGFGRLLKEKCEKVGIQVSRLGHRARATGNQQHRFPQAGLCKVGASAGARLIGIWCEPIIRGHLALVYFLIR